jgi:hypothetical protein
MGGTCVQDSVSRDQYVVFEDRVMRVVELGHYAWEASVFAGVYGVEGSGEGARALDLAFLDGFWSEEGSLGDLGLETRRVVWFEAPGVLGALGVLVEVA